MPLEINPFEYQKPNEEQIAQIELIRQKAFELFEIMSKIDKHNEQAIRYFSNAIKKLEETSMWANKAITFNK